MSLAREINDKLDQIIALKQELSAMESEVPKDALLTNHQTGDQMSVDDAIDIAYSVINKVKTELGEITNNGQNVKDIFTNKYYINDVMQDRELVEQENSKERNKPTDPNAEFISWDENA